MNANELKRRTKTFTIDIIRFSETLPQTRTCGVIQGQLVRSGCSVGANYRSACRARSKKDFVLKIGYCEEESDECSYWLEILVESGITPLDVARPLLKEAQELTAIFSASRMTARRSLQS
ncbi:MAG: hypothetical protein A2X67_14225 [Ignavibacteria bacterium GWA2_55_11]|nr:MAG: hypothetical protein A2X67_14225 [Ignavibacteria bacterium GWA2_55_11]OGU43535.1 MAG: hypothetical protein A2X68_13920 [Ignavibacteria bacterium GWC2_56_12]OGU66737.1 MAG: hypothetical protein A3C56_12405 [Ignavibacteria bacterium RIFCSPHIGHO2_02_FULL_56_12]OGU75934.1 MAG: hypothetical protein A3G43_02595 [Ignavibacteria bacterium RIFCSPLOWO2_12_FULL_56_21]HAV22088.1 four helix bundle protein [Bacteroidota bacterium]